MAIYLEKKNQRKRVKKKGLCWVPYVHRTCECSVHCVRPKVVYTDLVQLRSGASCQSGYTPHHSCDPVACAPCGHFWPRPCTSGRTVCIRLLLPVSPPSSIPSVSLGRTSPVITYGVDYIHTISIKHHILRRGAGVFFIQTLKLMRNPGITIVQYWKKARITDLLWNL